MIIMKYAIASSLLIASSLPMASASRFSHHFVHVRQQGSALPPTTVVVSVPPPQQNTPTVSAPRPVTTAVTTPATTDPLTTSSQSSLQTTNAQPTSSSLPPSTSSSATPTSRLSSSSAVVTSTNSAGQVSTIVTVVSESSSSASPSSTQSSSSGDSTVKPGTIAALSVVGGIAALGIIGFIVWKLTRKRFSDFDDPDEAIKWPEIRRESPAGGEDLSRQTSIIPSRNASALDQSQYADPYAVPPLPQFNPNQPYHDDPTPSGFYDPYRGPVPQSLEEGSTEGHESIPMSTYPPGSRTRSPGPGPSYDMGGRGSPALGRASPAPPGVMYDSGRGTPIPRSLTPAQVPGVASGPALLGGYPEMASRTKSPAPPPANILG